MQDCNQLFCLLDESVERNRADALLLGGLDSSILASMLLPNYSVSVGFGRSAPDLAYAKQVAQKYSKRHVEVILDRDKLGLLIEQVIQIFMTFDPIEVRNSVVALAAMEQAKEDGNSSVMTGDGGDELFAGYNYLSRYYSDINRLDLELRRLWEVMHFSSKKLGEHVGIVVKTPFLDNKFASFAKSIDINEKIGVHSGEEFGKFVLRRCFESSLGELVWRKKLAQEQGAAIDTYQNYIGEMIDDLTLANKTRLAQEQDKVRIRTKEHLNYYAIFRSYFPAPKENDCELRCPECQGCMPREGRFCRTCGAFPITPIKSL